VGRVTVDWSSACARSYRVSVSADGETWSSVTDEATNRQGWKTTTFSPRIARHVRITALKPCDKRAGTSFYELGVFEL